MQAFQEEQPPSPSTGTLEMESRLPVTVFPTCTSRLISLQSVLLPWMPGGTAQVLRRLWLLVLGTRPWPVRLSRRLSSRLLEMLQYNASLRTRTRQVLIIAGAGS